MRLPYFILSVSFCLFQVIWGQDTTIVRKPLAISSYMDMGQVVSGSNLKQNDDKPGDIKSEFLQRTGISLIQEVDVQKRLTFKVGVGGLFWYPWPPLPTSPYTRNVKFGPGISTAHGLFRFGDLEKPWMTAQFGFFAYKYNPDAMNLGEYLLRSTAYPSLVYTGGWSLMNSAANKTTGVRLSFTNLDGALTNDFGLFLESNVFPFNSISPAWIGSLKIGKTFEIGAGAVYQHLIAMRPSQLQPKDPLTTYVKLQDFAAIQPESATVTINGKLQQVEKHRGHASGPIEGSEQELMSMTVGSNQPYLAYVSNDASDTTVKYASDPNQSLPAGNHYLYARSREFLTFRGIKLMGRAALDLKPLLGMENRLGPKDLRIFAEAAVLGLQNQPLYYDKISKRIPIMLGFNLPTFKLLDILSVQMEYYPMEFQDSEEESYYIDIPAPKVPQNIVPYQKAYSSKDNHIKWSVYTRRNIYRALDLHMQVASDHLRLQEYTADRNWEPLTNRPSEWYYLFRLEFSI
jgi:hypothetical protein